MQNQNSQEKGSNTVLLRLGSTTTTTSSDEEGPIMFIDACSTCGSKKRKCLGPNFGPRKKMLLVEPPSSKDIFPLPGKSLNFSGSSLSDQTPPSFFRSISAPIQTPVSTTSQAVPLRRCVSDPITSPGNDNAVIYPSPLSFNSSIRSESFSTPKSFNNIAATASLPPLAPVAGFNRISLLSDSSDPPNAPPATSTLQPSPLFLQQQVLTPATPRNSDETKMAEHKDGSTLSGSSETVTIVTFPKTRDSRDVMNRKTSKEGGLKEENQREGEAMATTRVGLKCSCGKSYEVSFSG